MKLSSLLSFKLIVDAFCFFIGKGTAFLVPLLAAKYMSINDYGLLETSFAWGQQLTTIFVLGLPAAYPFFILKRKETAMQFYFWLYGSLLVAITLFSSVLLLLGLFSLKLYIILAMTILFSMERILSSILKTHGYGRIGVLIDSLYYFGLGLALTVFLNMNFESFFKVLALVLLVLIVLLGAWYAFMLVKRKGYFLKESAFVSAKRLLSYSFPLIFSGIIVYWLVACPKIYLSWFLGDEIVGIYSFGFRFIAISVLIYQFSYIMFFRKLYIVSPKVLDNNFSILIGLVFVLSIFFFFCFPFIKTFFKSIQYDKMPLVLLLICCFMPIWCATALNEGIIARENSVAKMNITLLPQIILFPLLVYSIRTKLSLELFCIIHLFSCSVVYYTQIYILMKLKVRFIKTSIIIGFITVLAEIIYLLF